MANQRWTLFAEMDRERMARMAAASAWGLGQWDAMERYVSYIPRDTTDGAFYRAVLAVHRDQFITASEVSALCFQCFFKTIFTIACIEKCFAPIKRSVKCVFHKHSP